MLQCSCLRQGSLLSSSSRPSKTPPFRLGRHARCAKRSWPDVLLPAQLHLRGTSSWVRKVSNTRHHLIYKFITVQAPQLDAILAPTSCLVDPVCSCSRDLKVVESAKCTQVSRLSPTLTGAVWWGLPEKKQQNACTRVPELLIE